jgi:hypothetical protein
LHRAQRYVASRATLRCIASPGSGGAYRCNPRGVNSSVRRTARVHAAGSACFGLDECSAHSLMVPQKRLAMRCTHRTAMTLVFQTDFAEGLALPLPHLRRDWPRQCHIGTGTGLASASLVPRLRRNSPNRCHVCAGTGRRVAFLCGISASLPYAGASYLTTPRNPSITIYTTSADASGPSFTPSSTYIAARTAPPPSSHSTVTGVRRY